MSKLYSEKIFTMWRFGYFDLFQYDEFGYESTVDKNGIEHEWKKLVWRLYWRVD